MDLHSNFPFSLLKNGILNNYPSLKKNAECDVVIIGAGISGAFAAWYLGQAGIKTIIVDKRHTATGSTSASTSLLQYEIDTPLHKLTALAGEKNAVESYQLCLDAIAKIETISLTVDPATAFLRKPSLQYASTKKDLQELLKEYKYRQKFGFPVYWMDNKELLDKYGLHKPGGIYSEAGAVTDAYKLTHHILQFCIKHFKAKVFDKTAVTAIRKQKSAFEVLTENGSKISCKKLVIACGYESQLYLTEKITKLHATYAIVSEPLSGTGHWYKDSLIWETANPYLYIRKTEDNRILIGGKDVKYTTASARDKLLKSKVRALEHSFATLFPDIHFKTDFSWAGTFSGTKDGLPYIGEHTAGSGIYFALGFGGNGITFSSIAGEIIRDMLTGKKNKHAAIFTFGR